VIREATARKDRLARYSAFNRHGLIPARWNAGQRTGGPCNGTWRTQERTERAESRSRETGIHVTPCPLSAVCSGPESGRTSRKVGLKTAKRSLPFDNQAGFTINSRIRQNRHGRAVECRCTENTFGHDYTSIFKEKPCCPIGQSVSVGDAGRRPQSFHYFPRSPQQIAGMLASSVFAKWDQYSPPLRSVRSVTER
jgi:hypothetical protein